MKTYPANLFSAWPGDQGPEGLPGDARTRTLLLDLLDRSQVKGAARARALNLAARLALRQADHVESRRLADASVAAARRLKDPLLIAQTLSGAGVVYHASSYATGLVSVDGTATAGNAATVTVEDRSYTYTVQSGDTLGSIAQKYGTTVNALTTLNPGIDPTALHIGQRIRVK